MMKRLGILCAVVAMAGGLAIPAAANPAERVVTEPQVLLEVENPCSESGEVVSLFGSTVFAEHLHNNGRFTNSTQWGSDGAWVGRATDTGVETPQGETVNHRWIVRNTETGEMFRVAFWGRFNENTGEFNKDEGFVGVVTCIKDDND